MALSRYPSDVSPEYLQALIAYEDRWFYQHPGVNPIAILRAAWQDLSSGKLFLEAVRFQCKLRV